MKLLDANVTHVYLPNDCWTFHSPSMLGQVQSVFISLYVRMPQRPQRLSAHIEGTAEISKKVVSLVWARQRSSIRLRCGLSVPLPGDHAPHQHLSITNGAGDCRRQGPGVLVKIDSAPCDR